MSKTQSAPSKPPKWPSGHAADVLSLEAEKLRVLAGKVERGEFRRPLDLRMELEKAAERVTLNYGPFDHAHRSTQRLSTGGRPEQCRRGGEKWGG